MTIYQKLYKFFKPVNLNKKIVNKMMNKMKFCQYKFMILYKMEKILWNPFMRDFYLTALLKL